MISLNHFVSVEYCIYLFKKTGKHFLQTQRSPYLLQEEKMQCNHTPQTVGNIRAEIESLLRLLRTPNAKGLPDVTKCFCLDKRYLHTIFHVAKIAIELLDAWIYFSYNVKGGQEDQKLYDHTIIEIENEYRILMQLIKAMRNKQFAIIFSCFFQLECRVHEQLPVLNAQQQLQQFDSIKKAVLNSISCLKMIPWAHLSFLRPMHAFDMVMYNVETPSMSQRRNLCNHTFKLQNENQQLQQCLFSYKNKVHEGEVVLCDAHEVAEISVMYLMANLTNDMFVTWKNCYLQTCHKKKCIKEYMRTSMHAQIKYVQDRLRMLNEAVYKKQWGVSLEICKALQDEIQKDPWFSGNSYLPVMGEGEEFTSVILQQYKMLGDKILEAMCNIREVMSSQNYDVTSSCMDVDNECYPMR